MKLSRVGEFGAIRKIAEGAAKRAAERCRRESSKTAGGSGDFLKTGIGDDAAVFKVKAGYECLVSTDLLIEGIHFDLSYTGPKDLGYKALAANLSDIAAMGGEPLLYFVSIAAPGEMDFRDFKRIFAGMEEAARRREARGRGYLQYAGAAFYKRLGNRPGGKRPGGKALRRHARRRHLGHRHPWRFRGGTGNTESRGRRTNIPAKRAG